ncbi:hypothetical protein [Prescottella equi]|nr:hypothetical protein [Prescottella equi]
MNDCKHCGKPIYEMPHPVAEHHWAHARNGWIVCEENPAAVAAPKETL